MPEACWCDRRWWELPSSGLHREAWAHRVGMSDSTIYQLSSRLCMWTQAEWQRVALPEQSQLPDGCTNWSANAPSSAAPEVGRVRYNSGGDALHDSSTSTVATICCCPEGVGGRTTISSRRLRNSGLKCALSSPSTRLRMRSPAAASASPASSSNPRPWPPFAMSCEPTLEVRMMRLCRKDTVRPALSVSLPSSSTCTRPQRQRRPVMMVPTLSGFVCGYVRMHGNAGISIGTLTTPRLRSLLLRTTTYHCTDDAANGGCFGGRAAVEVPGERELWLDYLGAGPWQACSTPERGRICLGLDFELRSSHCVSFCDVVSIASALSLVLACTDDLMRKDPTD